MGWGVGPGALLGPEGTSILCVGVVGFLGVADHVPSDGPRGGGTRRIWMWGCPLFENCTVDASIFVVKLVRAHGGCLGTRSR